MPTDRCRRRGHGSRAARNGSVRAAARDFQLAVCRASRPTRSTAAREARATGKTRPTRASRPPRSGRTAGRRRSDGGCRPCRTCGRRGRGRSKRRSGRAGTERRPDRADGRSYSHRGPCLFGDGDGFLPGRKEGARRRHRVRAARPWNHHVGTRRRGDEAGQHGATGLDRRAPSRSDRGLDGAGLRDLRERDLAGVSERGRPPRRRPRRSA
jgi:hypothetical protein